MVWNFLVWLLPPDYSSVYIQQDPCVNTFIHLSSKYLSRNCMLTGSPALLPGTIDTEMNIINKIVTLVELTFYLWERATEKYNNNKTMLH